MGRRKKPKSCYKLSLKCFTGNVIAACQRTETTGRELLQMRKFVSDIPNYASKEYTEELLYELDYADQINSDMLGAAWHPCCDSLNYFQPYKDLPNKAIRTYAHNNLIPAIIQNMRVMTNLTKLGVDEHWTNLDAPSTSSRDLNRSERNLGSV